MQEATLLLFLTPTTSQWIFLETCVEMSLVQADKPGKQCTGSLCGLFQSKGSAMTYHIGLLHMTLCSISLPAPVPTLIFLP